jgi:hypothetical protein
MPIKNIIKRKKYQKEYDLKRKEKRKKYDCERWKKIEIKEKRNKIRKKKRKTDLNFMMKERLSARLRNALNGKSKSISTIDLLGCDIEKLKIYLEKKFKPGMSWKNKNLIHIDHIRPCASFDLKDINQQKICFHYTNLQPLWAYENMSKGAKW